MILLITPSLRGSECATALENTIGEPAHAVKSFQEAAVCLRTRDYSVVVVDECLHAADPDQARLTLEHIETAMPVYVNGAVNGIPRIVEAVQKALQRRTHDLAAARQCALARLRSELREPLTGIMLNCELVLDAPNIPVALKEKIQIACDLTRQLGAKLQLDQPTSPR